MPKSNTRKAPTYRVLSPTGRVYVLKPGVKRDEFLSRPDKSGWKACTAMPSTATMEHWTMDCYAKATDGCKVEPDGVCPHGHVSWLRVLGYI